jgi:uncharacterized protein (DUF4415 family)
MAVTKLISLRVRIDTLEWYKARWPNGYQTIMLSVLRKFIADTETKEREETKGQ